MADKTADEFLRLLPSFGSRDIRVLGVLIKTFADIEREEGVDAAIAAIHKVEKVVAARGDIRHLD